MLASCACVSSGLIMHPVGGWVGGWASGLSGLEMVLVDGGVDVSFVAEVLHCASEWMDGWMVGGWMEGAKINLGWRGGK